MPIFPRLLLLPQHPLLFVTFLPLACFDRKNQPTASKQDLLISTKKVAAFFDVEDVFVTTEE